MSSDHVFCPACNESFQVTEKLVGCKVNCLHCGHTVDLTTELFEQYHDERACQIAEGNGARIPRGWPGTLAFLIAFAGIVFSVGVRVIWVQRANLGGWRPHTLLTGWGATATGSLCISFAFFLVLLAVGIYLQATKREWGFGAVKGCMAVTLLLMLGCMLAMLVWVVIGMRAA